MKISRKNFLRWTTAATATVAIDAALTACGGGGGGQTNSTTSSGTQPAPGQTPAVNGAWSNPSTWGGSLPTAADSVTIGSGQTVILDTNAVCLNLNILGTLTADITKNIGLTTGYVNVGATGVWTIGSEGLPYPAAYTCTITLNGTESSRTTRNVGGVNLGFTNDGAGRSIQVQPGGRLNFIGTAPSIIRTKLNANVTASAVNFTLMDSTSWKAGDEIAIGTTDFFNVTIAEKFTLSANASGTNVQTSAGISNPRWGVLQYVSNSGVTLNDLGRPTGAHVDTPNVLDARAFVIHLTRNIIVQGANDSAWITRKFGAHCMFMGRASQIKLNGVQFRRVGQAGAIGRYPIHWHMMSYNMPNGMNSASDGTFLGAVNGLDHYVKNCSVSESSQRMIVIHGTHGVTVDANVGFDIVGHAIFLEDGSEQDNVISNNVVIKVRAPTNANKLLVHDAPAVSPAYLSPGTNEPDGTSGIWLSNPKNTLTGNWVSDCEGTGIWHAFAAQCFGLSVNVGIAPTNLPMQLWDDNWTVGNKGAGAQTNFIPIDSAGNLASVAWAADTITSPLRRLHSFKNSGGGYFNRVTSVKYLQWVMADNAGMDLFGVSVLDTSTAENILHIAESLNNNLTGATSSKYVTSRRAAVATYHESLNFKNSIMVGYRWQSGVQEGDQSAIGGGTFRLWDLYTQPLFKFSQNTGIKLINCDAPHRVLPPDLDGFTSLAGRARNWTLAGAIHDVNGLFVTAGNYWIYDVPFLTYGLTVKIPVISASGANNGYETSTHFFGVCNFNSDRDPGGFSFQFQAAISVAILDPATYAPQASWNVGDGNLSFQLPIMRYFAVRNGGVYRLQMPGNVPTSFFEFDVTDMLITGDHFVIGVDFDSAANCKVIASSSGISRSTSTSPAIAPVINSSTKQNLTPSADLASFKANPTGYTFFQDKVNKIVWISIDVSSLAANYVGAPLSKTLSPVRIAVTT